ncbi:MAG TPA: DNA polymerase IV [Thermoanaerobaculia bacterium]
MRKIVHVDMDAFYASVEQRDAPELRGKPVVVAWKGARSVVCAASYEARKFGIRSAMPALRAARLCPDALFVPPDFTRYREVSRQIRAIFHRHSDLVEPLSLDEAYLDVTAEKTGLPSATETAKVIRAEIRAETALTASAGVAPNKFLAKIASDWKKPDGLFVIRPEEAEAFLTPLPVGKLPGVGKATAGALESLGIRTVGDLRAREPRELERRFGRVGPRLWELARGIDESPVEPRQEVKSISAEDTFPEDLALDELGPALDLAAERVWTAAERQGKLGRTVTLKLKTAEFRVLTRRLTPPGPPASAAELAALARELAARVELPAATRYRLAGVGLSGFGAEDDAEPAQSVLFDDAREAPES